MAPPKRNSSKQPAYLAKYHADRIRLKPPKILPSKEDLAFLQNLTAPQVKLIGNLIVFLLIFIIVTNLQIFFKGVPIDYYAKDSVMYNVSKVFILNDKLYIFFIMFYSLQSGMCDLIIPKFFPNMKRIPSLLVRLLVNLFILNFFKDLILVF